MQHNFVRDHAGVTEHCVFTSQIDGTVVVSLEVLTEMLMALGFRPVDTVVGAVVESDS